MAAILMTFPRHPMTDDMRASNANGSRQAAMANEMLEATREVIRSRWPHLDEERDGFYYVPEEPPFDFDRFTGAQMTEFKMLQRQFAKMAKGALILPDGKWNDAVTFKRVRA